MSRRVLVIGEYGILNGGENSFLTVASALGQSGWDFCAAVPQPSEFAQALSSIGIPTHALSMQAGGERKSQAQIRVEIAELIRRVNPDLVHCNSLSTSRLCGPIAREMNIPSIGYLRDIMKLSRQAIADINQLDRIIAVSHATKKWHCESGINANKTFVVFNGVDTDLFCPHTNSDATWNLEFPNQISSAAPILLFVGQIGIRKGVDILLQAFLEVVRKLPESNLLIAGQRNSQKREAIEYEQRLLDQAKSSKYNQQIHWLGRRTDVPLLMRNATLLIHPARQEPLGRVLLEASASGLPLLTTRVGGSVEILADRKLRELLIEPGNVDELVGKILQLLNRPDHLKTIGQQLRDLALQRFSVKQCSEQLNRHYQQILRS